MQYKIYQTKDNAQGQLDSNIGASTTTILLKSGEGAQFPQPYSGTTTSGGTSTTLNKTGIGASGVAVGDYIQNTTDGSNAFVLAVNTDSLTTSELQNGSDNTWQNGDAYLVNPFVGTINTRNADGEITASEKVKVIGRTVDSLAIDPSGGRGFDGSSPSSWGADSYFNLFSLSISHEQYRKAFADICRQLDLKASLAYVQAALASRNWKDPVVVATTTSGTLASSYENGDTVDGVVLATGDRILIKDQADPKENGIYMVNASGAPTRSTDFDATAEITSAVIAITKGTSNADTVWVCTADSPTIGVSDITFAQLSAALSKASQAEAQAGTDDNKFMTSSKVVDSLKANRFIARGGNGSDGDLTVTGTITLNLNQVYNFNNVSGTGTLTFTGSGSIALINVAGNLSGNFMIELRNTSSGDPSVSYKVDDGILFGGNSAQATNANAGGAGGTGATNGNGGAGGTSTSAGTGTAGTSGAVSNGAGGSGGGGGSAGGGGGGGGGATAANPGSNGSAASGNNGGAGGAGGAGDTGNGGGSGGGGGGGWNTGNGGAGGAGGGNTTSNSSFTLGSGGAGGSSGANGGNGGAGGAGGSQSTACSNSTVVTGGTGGAGGWGYSLGGAGGAGGTVNCNSGTGQTIVAGTPGNGGHSTYGTGGAGGDAGDLGLGGGSPSIRTVKDGGTGGNGRTGGAGGAGTDYTGSGYNLTGGNGGAGGHAKNGCAALYIAVRGNSTYTGTINGQGGNGGAGGRGGASMGTAVNSNGGAGGNGSKGADVVIVTGGTCSTPTINNLGGTGGAGGAAGTGGTGAMTPTQGINGTAGTNGANGIKIAQQLLI